MKFNRRLALALLAPGAALGLWLALGGALLWVALDGGQRATVTAAIGPLVGSHGMLMLLWWLAATALGAWGVRRFHEIHVAGPARLADAAQVLVSDADAPDLAVSGGAQARALAEAINGIARQRRLLQQEMERLVLDASRNVSEQRDQLGALMAELNQSVVCCNLDGGILLYNEQARQLFRRMSQAPGGAGGAELIGLGRSIHGVIDQALIAHALEAVKRRIDRGGEPATVSARFVTSTPAGHLLRVNLAPVRQAASESPPLAGFVLLLDDITEDHAAGSRRDRQLLELTESSRASLASIQAALDMLEYPDLDAEGRDRFHTVVRDEVASMSARTAVFAEIASQSLTTGWQLQEMLGADLLAAAQRRIESDLSVPLDVVGQTLWLTVDSFALIEALAFLAGRLVAAGITHLQLRLASAGARAHLDLIWSGQDLDPGALQAWRSDPMRGPLSVRDVAERHGGELWIERDRAGGLPFFRFLLPLAASEPVVAPARAGNRPEYYDFDLFARRPGVSALDDRLLTEIAYTVFDTETTGLDPLGGDKILQFGATRIVNGKLLLGECFDQLVDPGRSIPEASIRIHGIGPEHVRGKPSLASVLPAFHAFAIDTVLVGHNVAFDMRFLRLEEASSGVRFDQPILDTLLLSSIVHPGEASHGLEAIATRLGVTASPRHTALGDALSTAEVFLKLLPPLGQRGILTLSQALEASRASYYATLRY